MEDKRWSVDPLRLSTTVLNLVGNLSAASDARAQGKLLSQQHRFNAQQTLLGGVRDAADIRKAGRQTEGVAKAAMVAQGGVVDSEMLAKIKQKSDLDAIAAMYDAKADALTSTHAAELATLEAKRAYRANMLKAGSTILKGASSFNRIPSDKPNLKGLEYFN